MLKNAGVLFYTVLKGKRYFLLGQEAVINGYKNSGTWSAFEGGPEMDEDDALCALRECQEESLCAVLPTQTLQAEIAKAQKFSLEVTDDTTVIRFVLYAVRVPLRAQFAKVFTARREELLQLRATIRLYDECRKFLCAQNMPSIGRAWGGVVFLDIYHVKLDGLAKNAWVHSNVLRSGVSRHEIVVVPCTPAQAAALMAMAQNWTRVKERARQIDPVCLEPILHERFIESYRCHECYLEKSVMRWIDESELMNSLGPSSRQSLSLRYSFSVMMASILEHHRALLS